MPNRKKRELPRVGSLFEGKYKGKVYRLKVIGAPEGIAYDLGGRTFRTPTAAAKSVVKHEINGWTFWKMDSR